LSQYSALSKFILLLVIFKIRKHNNPMPKKVKFVS
jgi:hypothetical protein